MNTDSILHYRRFVTRYRGDIDDFMQESPMWLKLLEIIQSRSLTFKLLGISICKMLNEVHYQCSMWVRLQYPEQISFRNDIFEKCSRELFDDVDPNIAFNLEILDFIALRENNDKYQHSFFKYRYWEENNNTLDESFCDIKEILGILFYRKKLYRCDIDRLGVSWDEIFNCQRYAAALLCLELSYAAMSLQKDIPQRILPIMDKIKWLIEKYDPIENLVLDIAETCFLRYDIDWFDCPDSFRHYFDEDLYQTLQARKFGYIDNVDPNDEEENLDYLKFEMFYDIEKITHGYKPDFVRRILDQWYYKEDKLDILEGICKEYGKQFDAIELLKDKQKMANFMKVENMLTEIGNEISKDSSIIELPTDSISEDLREEINKKIDSIQKK